jgi:predicted nuclease of restriction endonuclease-like (RecB) superfamily
MNIQELADYRGLLGDIKTSVRQAQHRAALSANAEMIILYWDIGRLIAARQEAEGWGTGVIPRLAADLKNELPDQKGFSERNIGRMIAFYRSYPILPQSVAKLRAQIVPHLPAPASPSEVLPRTVAKFETEALDQGEWDTLIALSWAHNVVLLQKLKDRPIRFWYARQSLDKGWSHDTLKVRIKQRAHESLAIGQRTLAQRAPRGHPASAKVPQPAALLRRSTSRHP